MNYFVELGGQEVFVSLDQRGCVLEKEPPVFSVDLNCDWDGTTYLLEKDDYGAVIEWVCTNYPEEVWCDCNLDSDGPACNVAPMVTGNSLQNTKNVLD